MSKSKTLPNSSDTSQSVTNSLSGLFANDFEAQPAKPPRKQQEENDDQTEEKDGEKTIVSSKTVKKSAKAKVENRAKNAKTKDSEPKSYRILTYVTESDFDALEEVFDDIKRKIRRQTGKQLKVTNISELLLKYAADRFQKNSEEVLNDLLEELK